MDGARQQEASDAERRRLAVEALVKPLSESLTTTNRRLEQIGKDWSSDRSALDVNLRALSAQAEALRAETGKLGQALRDPKVRGRWGEIQLKRVVELVGMTEYCDFTTQEETVDAEGNALRPDLVVRLPGDRQLVVDAKTNIQAYLEALGAPTPEAQEACLDRFARHVADQVTELARKSYWSQYDGTPEFVVMFVPGDHFLDAAYQRRPELLETAAAKGVLLASPATLIGVLRAVALTFQESRLAAQAEELRELGREMHSRFAVVLEHIESVGGSLNRAVEGYNKIIASYQTRLEPTLRKFEEAGTRGPRELPEATEINIIARLPEANRRA